MEHCLQQDRKCRRFLPAAQTLYILISFCVVLSGIRHRDPFEIINACGTLALIPALWLLRRWLHLQGGYGLELAAYVFICMSWTLGGAAGIYSLLPGYDKLVHGLSGTFVSMLALAAYGLLEPDSKKGGKYTLTAGLFVFFVSMGIAALFELCEFTLAPLLQRDLQHVLDTGVADTMLDILVCMAGTVFFVLLMVRRSRGKWDPLTAAADGCSR